LNKVFSPQFSLWLLPFFALLTGVRKREFYAFEFSNAIAFLFIMAWYKDVSAIKPLLLYIATAFVIVRHAAMIFILDRVRRRKIYSSD